MVDKMAINGSDEESVGIEESAGIDEYAGIDECPDIADDGNDEVNDGNGETDSSKNGDKEDDSNEGLCAACQIKEIDFNESPHSLFCRECREEYIKLRFPARIKLFFAIICGLFLFSLYLMALTLPIYKVYAQAGRKYKAREYSQALEGYAEVLDKYSGSVPVIMDTASAAMKAQQFDALAYVLDNYLVGKNIKDADYDKAMVYFDFLSSYFETRQNIDNIFLEISETPEDEGKPDRRLLLLARLTELLERDGIDKTYVYFVIGTTVAESGEAIRYLRQACEQDPRMTYPYAYLGNALRRTGRYDEARQAYETVLSVDAGDYFALRGLSVIELLEGRKGLALDLIDQARALAPYGLYVPEAYIIVLIENGLRAEADGYFSLLESEGYVFGQDLLEYMSGHTSAEQYYTL